MKQMDHTLDYIHNYVAPSITDKGRVVSRKSSSSVHLKFREKLWGFFWRVEEEFTLLISRGVLAL